ncbi:hypothetical protein A9Q02_12445 [Candidatus Chloroploca asiatica]|uniref:Uncharacterized protein n=1 Tax=Candidatus Chloroploca asiatica TaxID=1506545 RepID=A0A2H3KMT7_9CHLR|nr:hypothetical protein A9Q02_12445 [Candidatus Chloroploca asiatica]
MFIVHTAWYVVCPCISTFLQMPDAERLMLKLLIAILEYMMTVMWVLLIESAISPKVPRRCQNFTLGSKPYLIV